MYVKSLAFNIGFNYLSMRFLLSQYEDVALSLNLYSRLLFSSIDDVISSNFSIKFSLPHMRMVHSFYSLVTSV